MSLSYLSHFAISEALHDALKLFASPIQPFGPVMRDIAGEQCAAFIHDLGGMAAAW